MKNWNKVDYEGYPTSRNLTSHKFTSYPLILTTYGKPVFKERKICIIQNISEMYMKFMAQRRTDYSLIVYVYEKRHRIRKQFRMKIRIEIDPAISEEEVVIKCSQITETVTDIQRTLTDLGSGKRKISFYKGETEYYLPIEEILFFETSNETVWAHTKDDEFIVKHKLYELEELLPHFFMRISKSSILNTRKVYSIMRNLTASSKVEFLESKKTVYVSRSYYKALRDKIELEIKN